MQIKEILKRINDFTLFNYSEYFLKFIKIKLYHWWFLFTPFVIFLFTKDLLLLMINFLNMVILVIIFNMFDYIQSLRVKNKRLELENKRIKRDFDWQRCIIFKLQELYIKLQQKNNIHFTNDEIFFLLKIAHPDKNNNSELSNSVTRKLLMLKGL